MSLFGSLQTNYMPSPLPAGRLPTIPDGSAGAGVGNGGNAFLSLVDGTGGSDGTSGGTLSMYSALSPDLAYRASLIGSMLDDVTNGLPVVNDPVLPSPEPDPAGDLVSGSAMSYEAADSGDVTNELQGGPTDPIDAEVRSPIEMADGAVTNALPRMDPLPA